MAFAATLAVLSGSAAAFAGDINNDGSINQTDLNTLLAEWGSSTAAADLNGNGKVDVYDLSLLLGNWGKTATKPAIPTGLAATAGDSSVSLNWNANPFSDSVDVYQVYENDQSYNLSVSGTSLVVTGLTNGTAYTFRVSAHNSAGYGDWTATAVSATPQSAGGGGGGGSGSGNGIGLIRYNAIQGSSNLNKYSQLYFTNNDAAYACNLTNAERLDYESGTDVPDSYSDGVDWNTANNNGWLLTTSGGGYLLNQGYPGIYIGDVGSSGYQQAWITNVSNLLASNHCNGVIIDDVLRDIGPLAGSYPSKYPSQASWQAAMASFINAVGPALKSRGYYVSINAVGYTSGDSNSNDGSNDVQWWQQLGPSVSGLVEENWQETAEGSNTLRTTGTSSWMQEWDGWQRLVGVAQNMGDDFVGLLYGRVNDDTQAMRYGKGSFLLDWNGGGSVFLYGNGTGGSDPWDLNWTTDMGKPTASKTNPQSGVWERTYANGIDIVNTNSGSVTVSGHSIAGTDSYIGP